MALDVKKPGRRTRGGGGGGKPEQSKPVDIYDVQDSDWDQVDIPLDEIEPNPFNEREMGDLHELAADIAKDGLDSPVSVMRTSKFVAHWGGRFPEKCARLTKTWTLGFGERRFRASVIAAETTGAKTIRCIVRDDAVPKIRRLLIRENYHRLNPTPLERARHIQTLAADEGMSYPEICAELNIRSKGTITKLLDLLKLPSSVQAAVQQETITQTGALKLSGLDEDQVAVALRLVVEEGMKPADAAHYARTAEPTVSLGNAESVDDEPEPEEPPADQDVVPPVAPVPDTDDDADAPKTEPASGAGASASSADRRAPKGAPKDQVVADRAVAARERELACIEWLRSDELPTTAQFDELVRRALLAGGRAEGRSKAQAWLVRAGKARFDIKDVEGYFGAVLSSDDDDLIQRATWAIALAGNEARAGDRRRPSWDAHDAAHVRELIAAVGYAPTTSWETTELERLGVSLGNAPDLSEQETA